MRDITELYGWFLEVYSKYDRDALLRQIETIPNANGSESFRWTKCGSVSPEKSQKLLTITPRNRRRSPPHLGCTMIDLFNPAAWGTTATTNVISLVLVVVTGVTVI